MQIMKVRSPAEDETQDGLNLNRSNNRDQTLESDKEEKIVAIYKTLAISYYNLGIEYEYLQLYEESMQSFQKGSEISVIQLGEEAYFSKQLKINFERIQRLVEGNSQLKAPKSNEKKMGNISINTNYNINNNIIQNLQKLKINTGE